MPLRWQGIRPLGCVVPWHGFIVWLTRRAVVSAALARNTPTRLLGASAWFQSIRSFWHCNWENLEMNCKEGSSFLL